MNEKGVVYLLRSKQNQQLYLGSTKNIDRRLKQHNAGMVTSTKRLKPWQLIMVFEVQSIAKARRIEQLIKKQKRKLDTEWIAKLVEKLL